jgi:hypothetical protein
MSERLITLWLIVWLIGLIGLIWFIFSERLITLWLRDWLHYVLRDWLHYVMLCYVMLCYERLDPLFLFIKSLRTCLFLRLFLPPRLRRLLRLSILTAVTPDLPFYHFIGRELLSLPIIVSVLSVGRNRCHNHRWLIL